MSKRIDIRGVIYNSILPLRFIENKNTHAIWKCKCLKCHKAVYASYINIVTGNTKSCASCGQRKLSIKEAKEIYKKKQNNISVIALAKEYNVERSTIYRTLKNMKMQKK